MRESLLWQAHGGLLAGHLGTSKTLSVLRKRFYWPKMKRDCASWIRSCLCCQRRKPPRPKAGFTQDISATRPFDLIGLDYCGPFRTTKAGNRYILTVCDYFSRWPILIPVPDQSTSTLVDAFLEHVVSLHGVPKKVFSDRGKSFTSKFFKRLCD